MAAIITLGFDNARVKAGAAETRAIMQRTADSVKNGWSKASAVWGGAASTLAAAAGVKSLIDHYSKLNDTAAKLDVNVEALQRIGNAAESVGTDAETVVQGLLKLNRALGDVGNTKAAEALRTFGLDAQTLTAMQPDEAILALSQAFQEAQAKGKGFSEIYDLLGRGASELLPVLRINANEMQRLFGIPVADKATVEALDDIGDKLTEIGERALPALAMGLQAAVTGIKNFVDAAEDMGVAWGIIIEGMKRGLGPLIISEMVQGALNARKMLRDLVEHDAKNDGGKRRGIAIGATNDAEQRKTESHGKALALIMQGIAAQEARAKGLTQAADMIEQQVKLQERAAQIEAQTGIAKDRALSLAQRELNAQTAITAELAKQAALEKEKEASERRKQGYHAIERLAVDSLRASGHERQAQRLERRLDMRDRRDDLVKQYGFNPEFAAAFTRREFQYKDDIAYRGAHHGAGRIHAEQLGDLRANAPRGTTNARSADPNTNLLKNMLAELKRITTE